MSLSLKQMMSEANREVPRIAPADAAAQVKNGDALLVDLRDGTELRDTGRIRGAVHVPRGVLEFRADPDAPSHHPEFRRDRTLILFCASGGRAALAGKMLKDFGYSRVYNAGGFADLADAGLDVEPG